MPGMNSIPLKTKDVSTVIAFGDLQKLKKNKSSRQFYIEPFIKVLFLKNQN